MSIKDTIKDLVALVQQTDNLQLYRKTLDLQSQALELLEQLRQKDEKINQLEQIADARTHLVLKGAAYYELDSQGKIKQGPFCTRCFDVDNIKARIVDTGLAQLECIICRTPYVRSEIRLNSDQ